MVPRSMRTVGTGADLRFIGRQPASDVRWLLVFSARPAVTFLTANRHLPFAVPILLLGEQSHVCEKLA